MHTYTWHDLYIDFKWVIRTDEQTFGFITISVYQVYTIGHKGLWFWETAIIITPFSELVYCDWKQCIYLTSIGIVLYKHEDVEELCVQVRHFAYNIHVTNAGGGKCVLYWKSVSHFKTTSNPNM